MNVLRTPDDRFADLPGFPFEPHYVEIDDGEGSGGTLRVHHLDEGPADGRTVLLLHGEPTWSYLYRHMVPVLVDAGLRCVVPDLVGFGRSDKPAEQADHSYERHVAWMAQAVFERLDVRDAIFFGQDWGSLIGLRLVAAQPDRFAGVVVGNGGMPTGDRPPTEAFLGWQRFAATTETFPVGAIVNGGCTTDLSAEVVAAYDAPFPDDTFMAGPRSMPSLVPTSPEDPSHDANVRAWDALRAFDRPFVCAFSDGDPITKGGDRVFLRDVLGAQGQPHTTVEGAGHFLQEDRGPDVARVIAELARRLG
jgi:haloalkane dehalogenase